jgi:Tfp pilus assembly protein PilF
VRAIYDWDWDAAETDFQEALALNPGYVTAHKYYSAYLTTLGRHDEAIREAERAVELDPKSPSLNHNLGMVLYFARDFERAAEVFEDVVDLEPKRRAARAWLAGANWYSGQREKAIAMVKEFDPVAEGIMSRLNEGNIEEARVFFDSIEHRLRPGIRKALWLAWVERWDDVLEYLEETVDDRQPPFVLMAFPGLDPLRDHPRYVALCQRMGLDAQSLARPSGRGLKAP